MALSRHRRYSGQKEGYDMSRRQARPKFIPPMWLVLPLMAFGVYGTSLLFNAISGAGPWGYGLLGLAAMLLSVLILGTPFALARIVQKQRRAAKRAMANARP